MIACFGTTVRVVFILVLRKEQTKRKILLVARYALHHEDIIESAIMFARILTLAQDGGGSSSYLLFREDPPVRFGDWMGHRADVEDADQRKTS